MCAPNAFGRSLAPLDDVWRIDGHCCHPGPGFILIAPHTLRVLKATFSQVNTNNENDRKKWRLVWSPFLVTPLFVFNFRHVFTSSLFCFFFRGWGWLAARGVVWLSGDPNVPRIRLGATLDTPCRQRHDFFSSFFSAKYGAFLPPQAFFFFF